MTTWHRRRTTLPRRARKSESCRFLGPVPRAGPGKLSCPERTRVARLPSCHPRICLQRSSPSPGQLRDQLVTAIVAGGKATTSGLLADYENDGEPPPHPGPRQVGADSAGVRGTQPTREET